MKILLLSDPNSPHTIKWAKGLVKNGFEITIFGFNNPEKGVYNNEKINVIGFNIKNKIIRSGEGGLKKIRYFLAIPKLRKIIKTIKPDIVHAHYASSYGLISTFLRFKPLIISVWGADVFDFPKLSGFHKKIIEYTLNKADLVLSTSNVMKKKTALYTNTPIQVVPFGINIAVFRPMKLNSLFNENDIVIGTVKTLEKKYGIEFLINAFSVLARKYPESPLKLLIVGDGSMSDYLKRITKELGIGRKTVFAGRIPYEEVVRYHNMLTISVSVSILDSESFGVAVLEASACEKPVIVSNVGGLPEVVENGVTGFVVPPKNIEKTAEAMEILLLDKEKRIKMGKNGRNRVIEKYDFNKNLEELIEIYNNLK